MAKRKFLFLYLTTGAGHISTARVLKEQILKQNPDAEVVMVNGFDKANIMGKVGFELLYFWATNFFHGLFPLIYDISQHRDCDLRNRHSRYFKDLFCTCR